MTAVEWRIRDGMTGIAEVDLQEAERLTYDGSELAETVARKIVEVLVARDGRRWREGNGPTVEIVFPAELSGEFAVSVSRTVRNGTERVGTTARRLQAADPAMAAAVAAATHPDDVEFAYEFLGNRYGHEIVGSMNDEEEAQLRALRDMYDRAILHDLGWPVRCKVTGRIGFLAEAHPEAGLPGEDERRRFLAETGCTEQPVTRWLDKEASFMVAFVPADRLGEAAAITEALQDLVGRPAAAPRGR